MKRLFSLLMAIAMICSLLTVAAAAAEPHTHVFDKKTMLVPATCQTEGVVITQCSGEGECELPGGVWTEPLSKVECSPMETRLGVCEASCEQDGYTGDIRCKWCMSVLEEGEIIPKLGHTPGDRVIDGWQSDEETTVRCRFCTVCKKLIETEKLPAEEAPQQPTVHEHCFDEIVTEIEPTCQTEGLLVTRCTADGYCDYADRIRADTLPKTECCPTEEPIGTMDATCLSEGRTGDTVCKWCLTVLEESTAIPKLAHTPADKRVGAIDATCISEGRTGDLLCKKCLTVIEESEDTPKADHTPGEWVTEDENINDSLIMRVLYCSFCKEEIRREEICLDEPTSPFTDIDTDAYYFDSVLWAQDAGITSGTSATTFSPHKVCTRAEVVTMLWRAAGSPAPLSVACAFTDVTADAYYRDAVLWAMDHGITAGTTLTTFSPDALCTRAQVMTMLWRSEGSPIAEDAKDVFIDVAKDDYFYMPVLWAVENEVTGGTGLFLFSPDAPCSRAQIVTFLYKAK